MMIIEIKSSALEQNANIAEVITQFLKTSVNSFLDDNSLIEKIVIADQESYGNEILQIQKQYECISGYTNNEMHLAIAKTITDSRDTKRLSSSIIFQDWMFGAILQESSQSVNINDWELDVQLFHYCIFHELAHCQDYSARKSEFVLQSSFSTNNFKISTVKEHYIDTILSEFAACILSSKQLTKNAFQHEVNTTLGDCEKVLSELSKKRKLFKQQEYPLVDLAYLASQSFWLIMVQFSKLIGSDIGENRNYPFKAIPPFTKYEIDLSEEIGALSKYLDELWKLYPVWNEENTKELFNLWNVIAKKQGYDFVEGTPKDSLWLK